MMTETTEAQRVALRTAAERIDLLMAQASNPTRRRGMREARDAVLDLAAELRAEADPKRCRVLCIRHQRQCVGPYGHPGGSGHDCALLLTNDRSTPWGVQDWQQQ